MIEYKSGNIFTSDAQAYVNPVNCVGVMGAGLAKQFKRKFPDNFKAYKAVCDDMEMMLGKCHFFDYRKVENLDISRNYPVWIINFPTKYHWKDKSKIDCIEQALDDMIVQGNIGGFGGIYSLAMPRVGCGLGGLQWEDVKNVMDSRWQLNTLNCHIEVWDNSAGILR